MALRLIEMILQKKDSEQVQDLLKDFQVLEHRQAPLSDSEVLVRILLDAEQSEGVLDLLEKQYAHKEGNRVLILPVEATLPRAEPPPEKEKQPQRIAREELYESIKNAASCSRVFLIMTILSTIVAAIGLYYNSVTIIIGAMVIAPLLGPNIALSLGTTLGDLPLLRRALFTNLAGIALVIVLSVAIGLFLQVDPSVNEIASRLRVGIGDFAVALASGCAGALGFTTGLSAIMIGVMVAVAVLPPLVIFGLLLGSGLPSLAFGALSLFVMNLICVNLAGVITFLVQGIHPASWWEKDRAVKATRIAIVLWMVLLGLLIGLVVLLQKRLI